jgi:hypothetical protein
MRDRNPALYRALHPRDEPLRDERERRADLMRHIIAAGTRARRRGVDTLTVDQIAAEMRWMIRNTKGTMK